MPGAIQVTVRDPDFHDRSRQKQLPSPTHLIRDLTNAAMALADALWTPPDPDPGSDRHGHPPLPEEECL